MRQADLSLCDGRVPRSVPVSPLAGGRPPAAPVRAGGGPTEGRGGHRLLASTASASVVNQEGARRASTTVPRAGGPGVRIMTKVDQEALADLHPIERELIARDEAAKEAGSNLTLDQLQAEYQGILARRHERLRRDADASWRSMEGWGNVTTEEEWRAAVVQADEDYDSGQFLLDRLGCSAVPGPAVDGGPPGSAATAGRGARSADGGRARSHPGANDARQARQGPGRCAAPRMPASIRLPIRGREEDAACHRPDDGGCRPPDICLDF